MNKTLMLAKRLDAQLTILNIEGICSDHQLWTDEETEIKEKPCDQCGGEGMVELSFPEDLDLFDDEELIFPDLKYCEKCEGTGTLLFEVKTEIQDSWTTSNIFL